MSKKTDRAKREYNNKRAIKSRLNFIDEYDDDKELLKLKGDENWSVRFKIVEKCDPELLSLFIEDKNRMVRYTVAKRCSHELLNILATDTEWIVRRVVVERCGYEIIKQLISDKYEDIQYVARRRLDREYEEE